MINEIDKRIRRALSGVRQAFRGVLGAGRSDTPIQMVQGDALSGELIQDAELFQQYGFTSNPIPGSQSIVVPIGGRTSHSVIIATEHASYRLKGLKSGEVALYTDEGAKIVLKRGRLIEVECDEFKVTCKHWEVNASDKADFNTPMLQASAQMKAVGQIEGQGGMAVSGGDGASFSGNVKQTGGSFKTDGDVVAGDKSLKHHKHPGDSGGIDGEPL